ncbi:MAG: zf-HC2 domain-containing protein [Pseudomonadota bacterium]|nr:zf-HC2 domain-containing protein [Pseudomonadota bacterium]
MLSCKEVCYIVSESLDGKLPWHERLKVRIHLLMCKACQRMVQQMELLRAAARRYESTGEEAMHPQQETLSKEASTRILARLRQAENDSADHE